MGCVMVSHQGVCTDSLATILKKNELSSQTRRVVAKGVAQALNGAVCPGVLTHVTGFCVICGKGGKWGVDTCDPIRYRGPV